MKLRTVLAIFLALSCMKITNLRAQSTLTNYFIPDLYPRSPTTSALEKFGTYQVNEFTGVPNISIPLYTIIAGKLSIPITLAYHASGIKISEVASWAGLGWSVMAGGQISRRTMGVNDDAPYGYLTGIMKQPGTYSTSNLSDLQWLENVASGLYDTKPDIFSYDFPGHNGKFFFDGSSGGNFTPRLIPYAPISITHSAGSSLAQFTIADERGNTNLFQTTEVTQSASGGHRNPDAIAAWKLTSMISQDKHDTIGISYNSQNILYPTSDTEVFSVTDLVTSNDQGNEYSPSLPSFPLSIGNSLVTGEQLPAQINFKNGMVIFDLDGGNRTDVPNNSNSFKGLADIRVLGFAPNSRSYILLKTITFHKSYFNPSYSSRLRLDSISITDGNGLLTERYRFSYNQSLTLPDYTSKQQDYWGYYNGKNNDLLMPRQSVTYNPTGSYSTPNYVTIGSSIANGRDCDSTFMQAYMLTGIHYPTGGYTAFTYQTNRYTDQGVTYLAGGLRIKSVSSYDGINPVPMVRTYQYNTSRKNFLLDYSYFVTYQPHRYYAAFRGSSLPQTVADCVTRSFVSTPHCDLEAFDGATVVYPSVTEYVGTGAINTGRTDYLFKDESDALSDASYAGNLIYISSFHKRGQLLAKTDYKVKSDGTYQPVHAESHTYNGLPHSDNNAVGVVVKRNYNNDGSVGTPIPPNGASPDDTNNYTWNTYAIPSDDNYLTSTTENDYDINDPTKYTTSTTNYAYANVVHQQPTTETHTDSRGGLYTKSYKYAADYLPSGYMTGTTGNYTLDIMLQNNMQAVPIEKFVNFSNPATSVNGVISGELYSYTTGKGNGNAVLPDKVSSLKVAASLTNFTPSTVSSGQVQADSRYIQTISFDDYDNNNDLTKYTPRNASATKVFWDYNRSEPVAKFQNLAATTQSANVAYTSFETANYGNWNVNGSATVANYAPTGMAYYNLSSGTITSPALDNSQAYIVSYWSNGGPATVATGSNYPGTALKSALGWTYYEHQIPAGSGALTLSGSVAIDELRLYPVVSQVTTYTYSPLIGITSMTDAKGMTTYYEYDGYQRLLNVKDKDGNIVKHNEYRYVNQ